MPETPDPDFDEFRFALPDRLLRHALGIQLSDADARLLMENDAWARTFFRQWSGEQVAADAGAPIALPRAIALAPPLPVPPPPVAEAAPAPDRPWWRNGRPLRAGIVAATVGSVLAASLVLVTVPLRTADASTGGAPAATDPFPAGLDAHATAAPSTAATGSADPGARLGEEVSAALRLDERTAAAPAVSGIVQKEVARIADVACLSGYDDATAQRVATAVAGQGQLDRAAGDAVADAIARYCAATAG